jgi:hypothetical protein
VTSRNGSDRMPSGLLAILAIKTFAERVAGRGRAFASRR